MEQVRAVLAEVERAVEKEGLWAAGFLAYEAAPAFDPAFVAHPPGELPLLWMGLFPEPEQLDALPDSFGSLSGKEPGYRFGPWKASDSREAYGKAIEAVHERIAAGDTYQANYTFRLRAPFEGDPRALFADLVEAQDPPLAAFLDLGRFAICSASPELFFELAEGRVTARPMKGTAGRDLTLADDEARGRWLEASPKNRAENLMIVDMMRNDLGRIAHPGSVRVPRLFEVERHPSVWQMTSTVEAETDAGPAEVLAALFPCASITGAPKARTTEILAGLESTPRGIYTGAVGYLAPGRRARFSVAIRTLLLDREAGDATYGVGGGIVWDSDAEDEYRECRLKALVLEQGRPAFHLLETMLWRPDGGFFLLDRHLKRCAGSAIYFGYSLDRGEVERKLNALGEQLAAQSPSSARKVRLLVDRGGEIALEASPLEAEGGGTFRFHRNPEEADGAPALRVRWASEPIPEGDPFLYHKTTNRAVYEKAWRHRGDADEVLLWNGRGEATEAVYSNLVVWRGGRLLTPPVSSGLLAGTFREELLARAEIAEEILGRERVETADALYLINSVRGFRRARLLGKDRRPDATPGDGRP